MKSFRVYPTKYLTEGENAKMDQYFMVIGTDILDTLLDRLLPIEGEDGDDVQGIERCICDLAAAVSSAEETVKKAEKKIPPEEIRHMESARKQWHPVEGETYYFFTFAEGAPEVRKAVWRNGSADELRRRLNNLFETEVSAWKFASGVCE